MIPNSIVHALVPEIALQLPADFVLQPAASGWSASDADTGAQLSILLKSSRRDGVNGQRLTETALALLQKKHPAAEPLGRVEQVQGKGWRGQVHGFRVQRHSQAALQLVLTTLISPDPADPEAQRNLIALVEVGRPQFDQRPVFYRRLVEDRLLIGEAASAALAAQTARPVIIELAKPAIESASTTPSDDAEAALASAQRHHFSAQAPASVGPSGRSAKTGRTAQGRARAVAALSESDQLRLAAEGQRVLVFSVLLGILVRGIVNIPAVPDFFGLALPAALMLYAISGVLKICSAFGHSQRAKLALMFCSSMPVLGMTCWVYLSIRTTRRLRAAGFEVGLLGVRT